MALSTDMLEAFIKVAERLSVSAAANDLDLGKAVVSKRVAQLESRLKVTLFSRSTRKIALTPAGEAYLDFARRALREVEAAAERLRELRSELSGRIRVSATVSWGQRVLALHLDAGTDDRERGAAGFDPDRVMALDGADFEAAIARMTPDQRERFARG